MRALLKHPRGAVSWAGIDFGGWLGLIRDPPPQAWEEGWLSWKKWLFVCKKKCPKFSSVMPKGKAPTPFLEGVDGWLERESDCNEVHRVRTR
jgi:hypothetical protein